MGTKGTSMQPSIFAKIREARAAIEKQGRKSRSSSMGDSPEYRAADQRGGRGLDRAGVADVWGGSGGDAPGSRASEGGIAFNREDLKRTQFGETHVHEAEDHRPQMAA